MNISINYGLQECVADISADCVLTEIAFAVESVTSHFLGRGISQFDCTRTRQENGNCTLQFKSLSTLRFTKPMALSKVCSIGYAVGQKYFPSNIHASELFQLGEKGFEKIVSDGQHKHGGSILVGRKKGENETTSVIDTFHLKPEVSLDVLTYGLGDMFTGLFALNCNYVKWQGSLNKTQLYIRHKLTEEQLNQFLKSNSDYDIRQKVKNLS